jgi:mevalonate kinase
MSSSAPRTQSEPCDPREAAATAALESGLRAAARAPGKVILFGEHAINRNQPAIAAAVGLHAQCSIDMPRIQDRRGSTLPGEVRFRSASCVSRCTREEILRLGYEIDTWRQVQDYESIRRLARQDFYAAQKYILATAFGDALPDALDLSWQSELPSGSGLGSGGSAFAAMVTALAALAAVAPGLAARSHSPAHAGLDLVRPWGIATRAYLAQLGDVVAHGGVASGLDTQTSLLGGLLWYTGKGVANSVPCAPGLGLVIAHCGVQAPTSEVNTRVREWLAEQPGSRIKPFETMGALAHHAKDALAAGDWPELGRLMTLNHAALREIGVSSPELERLVGVALAAGALGAKISGSGGGGIMIALVTANGALPVAQALEAAGGRVYTAPSAVPGARLLPSTATSAAPLEPCASTS